MRMITEKRKIPRLLVFLLVLFFLLWLYPRIRSGDIHDFRYADCLRSKVPRPYVIDICEILYYLTDAAILYFTIIILKKEDIAKRREELIRSVIMNVSGALIMMFYYPFLSVIPDTALLLCVSTGAFALSAMSVEMTKKCTKLTILKISNLVFTAFLLYISLIYELIA